MADILEYDAADAEPRFAELLDQIERGRMVRITRDGKPIARLMPETEVRRAEVAEAIERLKALREDLGKAPLDEVRAAYTKATSTDRA
jgi:prevent-host-death family protein